MMRSRFSLLSVAASAFALSACAGVAPGPLAFQARAPISAIDTDQTAGLRCLGRLIEASSKGPVEVVIGNIRDQTVPREFRDRRLSKGGEWWVHTAVSNLKTRKVRTIEPGRQESANGGRQILEAPDGPVKTIVVGVVDYVEVAGALSYDHRAATAPTAT